MRKLMSMLLALCLVLAMVPVAASAEGDSPETGTPMTAAELQDLLDQAGSETSEEKTVTLTSNVVVSDENHTGGYGTAIINVPAGVTLDGGKFSIIAENWNSTNQYHILGVSNTAAKTTTTIQNLSIVGNTNTKSGIHAYKCEGTVAIKDVEITGCGNAAVQVNGSQVTADGLTTSGNAWGAVNVDKGSGVDTTASFQLTSGTLNEDVKIWTELTAAENDGTDPVNAPSTWVPVLGSTTTAYAPADSLTKQVVKNDTTGKYYQALELAVKEATAGNVLDVYPGNYNIQQDTTTQVSNQTGWYLPIDKAITIKGVDKNGAEITDASQTAANIYSTDYSANGSWATQNLITVFADNVTISGVTIMNKIDANKAVEVYTGADNFTIKNCTFAPIAEELLEGLNGADLGGYTYEEYKEYGASLYFNGNVTDATVEGNYFDHSGITFDSTSEASISVTDNTFEGVKNWNNDPRYVYSSIGYTTWATPAVTDITNADLTIENNQLINAGKVNFSKVKTGDVDVSENYWEGMDLSSDVTGNATISTVYTDKEMTNLVTLADEAETLQDKLDAAEPNAVIDLGGEYWPGDLKITKSVTLKNGYVDTVTAIGNMDGLTFENITFRGASNAVNLDTNDAALYLQGTEKISNVLVDNCTFQGPASENVTVAITTLNVENLTVQDSTIDGYTMSAYHNPGKGGNISYLNNEISNVTSGIAFIGTDGVTVTGNTFENANGIRLEPSWSNAADKCSEITISENKFVSVSEDSTYGQYAVRLQDSTGTAGVDSEVALDHNYWGSENPNFDSLIVAPEEQEVVTEPYYEAETMRPEDLNTYVPSAGGGSTEEPEEPALPFTDVKTGDWFYEHVLYVYENNIMAGMSETTFEPLTTLDRAQAVQMLYNLEGQPEVTGEMDFTDVETSDWWSNAVAWASQNGVVAGYEDETFRPERKVTREEFAQMLYNYAEYKEYDLTASADLSKYPDAGKISGWAETAMAWANGNGLINGHDNGMIDPIGTATRAQAASILANFDKNIVTE